MSLEDLKSCNQSKTWVIPLLITVQVDNVDEYDDKMKIMVDRVTNELRGVARHFDKSGKQLVIAAGAPVKNIDQDTAKALLDIGLVHEITEKDSEKINARLEAIEGMVKKLLGDE